jgi:hypothetical protein
MPMFRLLELPGDDVVASSRLGNRTNGEFSSFAIPFVKICR